MYTYLSRKDTELSKCLGGRPPLICRHGEASPRPRLRHPWSMLSIVGLMGAESGGDEDASPIREISWERPTPRNKETSVTFFLTRITYNFAFSNIFQIKWPKSEEKLNFGG